MWPQRPSTCLVPVAQWGQPSAGLVLHTYCRPLAALVSVCLTAELPFFLHPATCCRFRFFLRPNPFRRAQHVRGIPSRSSCQ